MINNPYTLTLLKAFDILNCFDLDDQEISIKEISARIEMPQSSVYRIIQSLYGGEKVEHTGIGMMNVQQRLIAIYGNGHGLQIVSSEEGTDVRMNIPCSVNAGAAQ